MKKIIAVLFIFISTSLFAHNGATGVIKDRMDTMSDISDANKLLSNIARGRADFDIDIVKQSALTIHDLTSETLDELFPEGSLSEESEAKGKIWQDWDKFIGIRSELNDAALNLSKVKNAEQFPKLFKAVSNTCRSCHKTFRAKK